MVIREQNLKRVGPGRPEGNIKIVMKTLQFIGMVVLVVALLGGVLMMAGGVAGLLKIVLALVIVPFVVLLLMPKFWLGFFAGDLRRLLFGDRGRR